jgi:hypothetical protein
MRSYYEENKEAILKRRRQRYQTDPEFRERLCAQRRESMKRRRLLDGPTPRAPKQATGTPMKVNVNGKTLTVTMYTLSEVAAKASVSRNRLHSWTKSDWFIKPTWNNAHNHAIYTQYEMEVIVHLIASYRSILAANGYKLRVNNRMKDEFIALKKKMVQGVPLSVLNAD